MTQEDEPEMGEGRGPPYPVSRASEPILTAPWPPLLLAGLLIGVFGLLMGLHLNDAAIEDFGFMPLVLSRGPSNWFGLVTSLFIHGGWAHVLFNSGFALAFGAPVSRRFGLDAKGGLAFFAFFIVTGVAGNLGFALAPHVDGASLVGASGGVSGLMGAASRLMGGRPKGALARFSSPTVVGMAAAWIVGNLVIGLAGIAPLSQGASIAWQAHLAGYAAGLFLIAPVLRMLGIAVQTEA